ncbi:choline dehydrogenase [Phyllosticta capitalensis]|uniref:choline dehydrogenase n=1 Tax=Phyllosticta capitalensis TaxID=121624 RepID=UPI0031317052
MLGGLVGTISNIFNGLDTTYDYVVVGGGTAGNTIAYRLAAAGNRVAVLEAGNWYEIGKPILGTTPLGDVVGVGMSRLDYNPLVDWGFMTTPQAGCNNRQFHYARGKALGGSSALNFMIYQRGTEGSYQQWADDLGDNSYTFDNLLPYFEKSLTFSPPDTSKRLANATTEYNPSVFDPTNPGPVHVSYSNFVQSFATWLIKGFNAVGIQTITDFNSGNLLGTQYAAATIRPSDATRSASDVFIQAALTNPNLKVYINTLVKKIIFDKNKKATGVKIASGQTITARKEVIISAGAFQSPQLLMVSGIGPKDQLNKFKIPIIQELPGVGQNMWDHIMFGPSYEVDLITLDTPLHDLNYALKILVDYIATQSGPLSSNVCELLGWEKISQLDAYKGNLSASTLQALSEFPADWPEAEWISIGSYIGDFLYPILQQPLNGRQYATILGAIVAPTSRGNVTLKSADTKDLPLVNPNWLTSQADRELAVSMYRRMREIWNTPVMQQVVKGPEYFPGLQVQTDEQILETIKESLTTVWHASCTCKMSKQGDPMGVIDSKARVFGVQGLRVVDASSFPSLPPGHPQSTVYMLAEKIAADILNGN